MGMKISERKREEIQRLVRMTSNAYLRYRKASALVEKIITPFLNKATRQSDIDLLLWLTSPVDRKGKYTSGDYIGRIWIYYKSEELKAKKKGRKNGK